MVAHRILNSINVKRKEKWCQQGTCVNPHRPLGMTGMERGTYESESRALPVHHRCLLTLGNNKCISSYVIWNFVLIFIETSFLDVIVRARVHIYVLLIYSLFFIFTHVYIFVIYKQLNTYMRYIRVQMQPSIQTERIFDLDGNRGFLSI